MEKIAIIGLGYVGLPLARLFATRYPVVGYDINQTRVTELMSGHDATLEVEDEILQQVLVHQAPGPQAPPSPGLFCTTGLDDIRHCTVYIITVPTPIDKNNRPDLTPLIRASETVGNVISKGDIIIYESTVYPGATEEDCIPVVEKTSGLTFNTDFFAGYSPERINPGDKEHTVEHIKKVTSGSTPEAGQKVDALYRSVITAGTHLAPTIKVAEAAKVIENSQRDINIAFVNELAKIFNRMDIDTHAVLQAAGTKWNFLPFKPGLVGGHCIGVDPYYLAQKAQEVGYHPEIILAGRRMNDSMGAYVASEVVKLMIKKGIPVKGATALMLGITFKENCPDIRNTRAIDIVHELADFGMTVDVYDPWASPSEVMHEYGIQNMIQSPENSGYSAIILAVAHRQFLEIDLNAHKQTGTLIYDVKGILDKSLTDGRL
ncbi:nucleotide sugar dehydrogenase [Desulfotignum phosphitoxidans]|uniref:UDP-N-acetyl-D-galactosamine dehydrogenase n=1 Tax=Desulfotignum phosphitoxidans DSM 13687 TaxID=1286635 RepID=S0FSG4_9BACT|nr:nucleotide sugar dehydrogenase [Desulfotignum phosphitoxidans]EMS77635.1 UDP-N-acetyl-D-galactosamine dehydrogenase [Desulfotignum phosphitoxidans DSM 13687]